jgi:K+-transporting ATPase ATPase C chain
MLLHLRRSIVAMVVFTVICGLMYPLLETGLAQWWFPSQANGSITANGSTLIGQQWKGPGWFHGRPDADNPLATGPSSLGPTSKVLAAAVQTAIREEAALGVKHPPADLVTTSGSGVDPDISPAAALVQVDVVARARGLSQAVVRHLVVEHENGEELGFLGAPTVDVLQLNEALAKLVGSASNGN